MVRSKLTHALRSTVTKPFLPRRVSPQSWKSVIVTVTLSCVLCSQVLWFIFGLKSSDPRIQCWHWLSASTLDSHKFAFRIHLCVFMCACVCFRKRTGGRRQTRSFSGKTQTPNSRNHWSADWSRPGPGPWIPQKLSAPIPMPPEWARDGLENWDKW